MNKIIGKVDIHEFKAWCGGKDTLDCIKYFNKLDELQNLLDSMNIETWREMELNDFLWFEEEYVLNCLGIRIRE